MTYQPHQSEDLTLKVGGRYNWRNQPERLVYIGSRFYPGDRRRWHQFAKVDSPDTVWSEVLDSDLPHFEETRAADGVDGTRRPLTSDEAEGLFLCSLGVKGLEDAQR